MVFPIISSGANIPLHRRWLIPAATCGGVLFHSVISADSPHSTLVVSPSAICAGGASSSSHWRKNCTDTRSTCTVSVVVVVVCLGIIYKYETCIGIQSTCTVCCSFAVVVAVCGGGCGVIVFIFMRQWPIN